MSEPGPAKGNASRVDLRIGREEGGTLLLSLSGRLDADSAVSVWDRAVEGVRRERWTKVVVDASGLEYMDGAGFGLLSKLRLEQRKRGGDMEIKGLSARFRHLVDLVSACDLPFWSRDKGERRGLAETVGRMAGDVAVDLRVAVSFVGECFLALCHALAHPRRVRWKDVLLTAEKVGVQGLPIIGLIGFLMGLIMSFQTAMSLQKFGGEIFVPNMLGLVMFRELGPLVTAILLAGRSGSAFAAEIGTMKVNEEVDALTTMGLAPVRFLVTPKVLATLGVMPFLTIFFNFFSLIGGAVVMLSLDYPLATYTSRVFTYVSVSSFVGGMFKALVFSLLVAGVGCLRGLETRTGASAVGASTTSAVVSAIILIAVADGLFAVLFYYLGI
ncbi:MAG: ABC transporter permease [Desulfovibrionaceae bacterium]|nr:ABC transporter permease [Desulfovibrionaceae bacterium]